MLKLQALAGAVVVAAFAAPAAAHHLDDAKIAGIAETLNAGEVAEGKLAATRATDSAVVFFANKMVGDHSAANAALELVLDFLGITVEDSKLAAELRAESAKSLAELAAVPADEFDCAYMTHEVQGHAKALHIVDDILLPQAHHFLIRGELRRMRGTITEHLEIAERIVDELGCCDHQ